MYFLFRGVNNCELIVSSETESIPLKDNALAYI